MSNNKQSSVELFIEQLEEKGNAWENVSIRRLNISIDVSDYMELKQQVKAKHNDEVESLNARWAKSREQTKDVALSIGVKIGFELALQHYEDYYEQLDKTDLDEDDFMRDYISKIDKQYKQ